jgi:Dolichyl-phosphate-mannose-protein mannosyltransferase
MSSMNGLLSSQPSRRTTTLALAAVTLLALGLRLWGIRFGFPHTEARPDEEIIVPLAIRLWANGPNPHFFDWPTLYLYVLSALYAAYFTIGRATGEFASVAAFIAASSVDANRFQLIARLTAALLGTATVPLLYAAARRLFTFDVAIVAATLLAVAFLHVRESHFGMTEVPATFMIVLAFAAMVMRPMDWTHRWSVLGAALLCGLAASTKYNALVIVVPLYVLVAQQEWSVHRNRMRFAALFALLILGVVAGFCLGTPYAVLDYPAFHAGVVMQRAHLAQGHGVDLGYGWTHHLVSSLWYGLGWPMLVAALIGGAWLVRANLKTAVIVLSFPVVYYAGIGSGRTVFARYILPMIPFICLSAAIAIAWTATRARETRLGRLPGIALIPALTALVASLSVARSISIDRLLTLDDNRVVAARALEAAYPSGATIIQLGAEYARLQLSPAFSAWIPAPAMNFMAVPAAALPELVVVPSSRLRVYTPDLSDIVDEVLRARYRLVARFDVEIERRSDRLVYDEQDAFFAPLSGFNRLRRAGPSIEVFARAR